MRAGVGGQREQRDRGGGVAQGGAQEQDPAPPLVLLAIRAVGLLRAARDPLRAARSAAAALRAGGFQSLILWSNHPEGEWDREADMVEIIFALRLIFLSSRAAARIGRG